MSLVNVMEGQKCVIRTPGNVRLIYLCILCLLLNWLYRGISIKHCKEIMKI